MNNINNATANNIEEYAYEVGKEIRSTLGEGYAVEDVKVPKNNGCYKYGVTIGKEGENVRKCIYVEDYYSMNAPAYAVAMDIITIYKETSDAVFTLDVKNYQAIKDKVCFKLINAENNREMLKDMPHISFENLGLAVVFYLYLNDTDISVDGYKTITIGNSLANMWGIDTDSLYKLALENTARLCPPIFENIMSVLSSEIGYDSDFSEEELPLYILTNEQKQNGAGVFLYPGMCKEIARRFGSGFYLIPSSIHETLLLPWEYAQENPENIREMINAVNTEVVLPEEILSYKCYSYDPDKDEIMVA